MKKMNVFGARIREFKAPGWMCINCELDKKAGWYFCRAKGILNGPGSNCGRPWRFETPEDVERAKSAEAKCWDLINNEKTQMRLDF